MRARLCLYVVGAPPPAIQDRLGRFEDMFGRLAAPYDFDLQPVDGTAPDARLDPDDFAGIVITGSPASLTAPEPWMEAAIDGIRRAREGGTPLLGACFGHQLIGAAAGGRIEESPEGWELGTREIELTRAGRADPLFTGLPDRFEVNLSHQDVVSPGSLPAESGAIPLAENARSPFQALAWGETVRGVQFHPEFDGRTIRAYIDEKRADLTGRPAGRDAPAGERVFENWVRELVLRA